MSFLKKGFTLIEIMIVLTMMVIFAGAIAYLTKDPRVDQTKAERLAININDTIKNARNNMVIGRGVFSGSSLYPTTQRTIRIDNGSIRTIYAANSSTGTETDTNYPFFDNDGEYKIIDISVSSGVVSGNQMIGWDHTGVTMTEIIIDGKGGMQILARQGMTDISTPINAVRITAGYGVFQRSVILDRVVGRSEVVQDGGESVFSAAPPTSSCSGILPLCNGSSCTLVSGTPTTLNQPWVKDATSCGFTCNAGVSGDDCEILPPPVCATPDPSFSYIGTLAYFPTGVNQAWTYSAIPGSCTYSCTNGYSGSGCLIAPSFSCAANPSFPKIGALSPGTPTSVNQAWSYGAINCGYACIDGFTGSGCATPPPSVTGFTTTWRVGTATYGNGDNTVQFNVTLSGASMIDWGDGNVGVNASTSPSHTYATAGDYTIKISGISRFWNNIGSNNYHGKLFAVTDWGGIAWSNMASMFLHANHFNGLPVTAPNTVNVTSMSNMFNSASIFNQSISTFNTSNVTDMSSMFTHASAFNQSIANFNTNKVTNMSFMFYGATVFDQSLSSFDTSNVTDMRLMFYNAKAFDQSLSLFDTSKVTDMSWMFQGATVFDQSLSSFDTSKVTDMSFMFQQATAFNQSLSNFDTSQVTNMAGMFNNATVFNRALSSFDTSQVTNMAGMFQQATAFNQDISSFDTSKVTDMSYMFFVASSFNQDISNWCVPLIGSKPTSFDTSANAGFAGNATKQPAWGTCPVAMGPAFTTTWRVGTATYGNGDNTVQFNVTLSGTSMIDWGDGNVGVNVSTSPSHTYAAPGDYTIKISGITTFSQFGGNNNYHGKLLAVTDWGGISWSNMIAMFQFADHFNGLPGTAPNMTSVTNMQSMFFGATVFNQPVSNFNTSNVTSMSNVFNGAAAFNQSLSAWNTSNVTNMISMFSSASSFNQSLSTWNTSQVTNMSYMFNGATAFNQSVANFNTSNVTNMASMFAFASAFNQSVSNFDTTKVTSMAGMFANALVFNQPVSSFNTSNVTNMGNMFLGAGTFNQSVSNFDTTKVTNMSFMFNSASAFNQSVANFNTANVTNMSGMFLNASAFNQSVSNFDTTKVTDMSYMFGGTILFNQPVSNFNTANVTNMFYMFGGAILFNQSVSNFDTTKVTDMTFMFVDAKKFNQPVSNFNTANVISMQYMFQNALDFNQSVANFNTAKVTNMGSMFNAAKAFNQSVSNFDTTKVTDMSYMFQSTINFNQPLTTFNTSNVTNMRNMFWLATGFNQDLSSWVVNPKVINCANFSAGASAWVQPKPTFSNCTP